MKYSEKLRDPRWQRKRLEILSRDNFTCRLCGDAKNTLHVHHIFYTRGAEPWDHQNDVLVTVCVDCHEDLTISDFGNGIIQAAIVGGITRDALYSLLYGFQFEFYEGPFAAPMPREKWEDFVGSITFLAKAVRRGVSEKQIRLALEELKGGDGKA